MFSVGDDLPLPPRGYLVISENFFVCQHRVGEEGIAADIYWIENRDAAKILQCTGQLPTTKNYLIPNASISEVEKPCISQRS